MAAPARPAPPPELADYVSEFFYPALGSQFTGRTFNDRQRQQIADYRSARRAALEELRRELAAQREADAPARQQALAAFARRQTPRLAELERTAEQLRIDLIPRDRNWNEYREWKLSQPERRGFSPVEIAQVMRAYAFYHKGLLPAQRRLLREIALELANAAETAEKAAAATQHYVFFSPDMSRVTFPSELSSPLAAKIALFQSDKARLKKELYDTIVQNDGRLALFSGALKGLAEKQAGKIAQLEALAEEIRVGLGDTGAVPPELPRSPLPLALTSQLADILERHAQAQQATTAKLERLTARARADNLPVVVQHRFDETGLKWGIIPRTRRPVTPQITAKIETLRESLSAAADEYGRTLAELVNQRDEVRRAAGEQLAIKDVRAIDSALSAAMRALARRETETAYQEYRTAVFLPGLSPEQRRLLLDAAIESLRLPLPRGEMQPTRRGNSW